PLADVVIFCASRVTTHKDHPRSAMKGGRIEFYCTFGVRRVASHHGRRHKGASSKGSFLPHPTAITAILSPAKAAADLRVLSLGMLLLTVILIPLSRAV